MPNYKVAERPLQNGVNGQGGQRERSRRWKIITDDPAATPDDILSLRQIPLEYQPYPGNPRYLVKSVQCNQTARFQFDVIASYSNEIEEKEKNANPLARPAVIEPVGIERQIPTLVDSKGKPYTNTAGDIVPGHTVEIVDPVFNISKSVAAPPRWLPEYWRGVVNSDDIRILGYPFKARHLKFKFGSLTETQEGNRKFWNLKFSLISRFESWDVNYANVGRREIADAANAEDLAFLAEVLTASEIETYSKPGLQDILVGNPPRPTDEPVWLNSEGKAIREKVSQSGSEAGAIGNIKTQLDPSEIIINKREGIPGKPFSTLQSVLT